MQLWRPYMLIPAQWVPYKPFPRWMKNRGRYRLRRFRATSNDSIMRYHGSRSIGGIGTYPWRPFRVRGT